MAYLGILGWNLKEKTFVILKISVLKFVKNEYV